MKSEIEFLRELWDCGDGMIPCSRDCDCDSLRDKIKERLDTISLNGDDAKDGSK